MNFRRGLFRLWIIASLVWFVGWLGYLWAFCEPTGYSGFVKFCSSSSSFWNFGFWSYESIAAMGIGPAMAAFILGLAGLWAAKGFQAKSN